jgi:hypothetical protein
MDGSLWRVVLKVLRKRLKVYNMDDRGKVDSLHQCIRYHTSDIFPRPRQLMQHAYDDAPIRRSEEQNDLQRLKKRRAAEGDL